MSACALHRWKINLTVVHDFVEHDFVFVLKHSKPKYVYDLLRTRVTWDISKEMTKWLFDKVGSLSGIVIFRLIYYDHVDKQIKVQSLISVYSFLCCVFLFCLSSSCVLCTQCCQFLWIVHSWLPPLVFSDVNFLRSLFWSQRHSVRIHCMRKSRIIKMSLEVYMLTILSINPNMYQQ